MDAVKVRDFEMDLLKPLMRQIRGVQSLKFSISGVCSEDCIEMQLKILAFLVSLAPYFDVMWPHVKFLCLNHFNFAPSAKLLNLFLPFILTWSKLERVLLIEEPLYFHPECMEEVRKAAGSFFSLA